jgi:hypothetical protein
VTGQAAFALVVLALVVIAFALQSIRRDRRTQRAIRTEIGQLHERAAVVRWLRRRQPGPVLDVEREDVEKVARALASEIEGEEHHGAPSAGDLSILPVPAAEVARAKDELDELDGADDSHQFPKGRG